MCFARVKRAHRSIHFSLIKNPTANEAFCFIFSHVDSLSLSVAGSTSGHGQT